MQKSVKKVHKEFDSMLGIDVYDKLKDDKSTNPGASAKNSSLYAICQDVGVLGEMAVGKGGGKCMWHFYLNNLGCMTVL